MKLLTGLILCLSSLILTVRCDTFPECENVPAESFIPSPNGCASYIYCDGNESFEANCPDNLFFNPDESNCDNPENVQCGTNQVNSTTLPTTTTTTTATTTVISTTSGSTDTSTTVTSIITSWPGNTTATTTVTPPITTDSNGQVVCPQPSRPEEIIYLPNPESCSDYYMCYSLTAIPMTCPIDLQFNSLTGKCDWAYAANCQIIQSTTVSPRDKCTPGVSGYYDYPGICRYYYRCTNGLLTIQECPVGFGWDSYRKMCTTSGCSN